VVQQHAAVGTDPEPVFLFDVQANDEARAIRADREELLQPGQDGQSRKHLDLAWTLLSNQEARGRHSGTDRLVIQVHPRGHFTDRAA
jgi:hypothetical protein